MFTIVFSCALTTRTLSEKQCIATFSFQSLCISIHFLIAVKFIIKEMSCKHLILKVLKTDRLVYVINPSLLCESSVIKLKVIPFVKDSHKSLITKTYEFID